MACYRYSFTLPLLVTIINWLFNNKLLSLLLRVITYDLYYFGKVPGLSLGRITDYPD
jgi:hypothetical protein